MQDLPLHRLPVSSLVQFVDEVPRGHVVIYYPPTTGRPYLVVTFLADRILQATPFDSEEAAEAFIEQDAASPRP